MKIRMLTGLSGNDFSLSPGDEPDCFDDIEAGRLVDAGFAVAVAPSAPEATVKKAPAKTAAKKSAPETRG